MNKETKNKPPVDKATYFFSKKVGQAIADYQMLKDGDKVVVAVSGGKDSFTLLKMLKYRQSFVPIKFDLLAVHVDLGFPSSPAETLRVYCATEGIPCHIEKKDILNGKGSGDISCFWCSWNRRKVLFELADQFGFNKIALGHHMDDIVETTLLNMFYQGNISTMNPRQELFGGKLTIIRPLAYLQKKEISRFQNRMDDFSHDQYICPNNDRSKRMTVQKIIRGLEEDNPHIKRNIFESIRRINLEYVAALPERKE